jgi:hypothetical protein
MKKDDDDINLAKLFPSPNFVALNNVDNEKGKVSYVCSIFFPGAPIVVDKGCIYSIVFKGKKEGKSNIEFESIKLVDPECKPLKIDIKNAQITIAPKQNLIGIVVTKPSTKKGHQGVKVTILELNRETITDSKGYYSFEKVPVGKYTLKVEKARYLPGCTQKQEVVIELEKDTFVSWKLLAGDITADGRIDIFDLVKAAVNFESSEPTADTNEDGSINILDLVTIAINIGKTSKDTPYEVYKPGSMPDFKKSKKLIPKYSKSAIVLIKNNGQIEVDSPYPFYGVEFTLKSDPSFITSINDAQPQIPGIQIKAGDIFADNKGFVAVNAVDKAASRIKFAATLIPPSIPQDSATVAIIPANSKLSGLSVEDIRLASVEGYEIPVKVKIQKTPTQTKLLQNYPNPFNPETWIPYELPEKADVVIKIYNLAGQLVRVLDIGIKEAGSYTSKKDAAYWDGKTDDGNEVASGVYFYQLFANGKVLTRQMVVLK